MSCIRRFGRAMRARVGSLCAHASAAGVIGTALLAVGLAAAPAPQANAQVCFGWNQSTQPQERFSTAMAYDSFRNVVVMTSGRFDTFEGIRDTWEWNGTGWLQRRTATQNDPGGRFGHAVAYDSHRKRLVLFGGRNLGTVAGDTWEWDGERWQLKLLFGGPSARDQHTMVYDTVRRETILFGGFDTTNNRETWAWNGTTWTLKSNTGPAARVAHAMAWDENRGVAVMFGGVGGTRFRDIWEWNGSTWTLRANNAGPSARDSHTMAFDPVRGETLVFGGDDGAFRQDTWAWTGSSWIQKASTGPRPSRYAKMAFDGSAVMLFGGQLSFTTGDVSNETWAWNGTAWSLKSPPPSPAARRNPGVAFDSNLGTTLLFGGTGAGGTLFNDTWSFDGFSWRQVATAGPVPSPREGANLVFDANRNRVVLFGGGTNTGQSSETWEWDGAQWSLRSLVGPSGRAWGAFAFDPDRNVSVYFGGANNNQDFRETWEWNGIAWTLRSTTGPSARSGTAAAWDPVRRKVILFSGGANGQPVVNGQDTWEWNGTTWTLVAQNVGPAARFFHSMVTDTTRGVIVLFGGKTAGPLSAETWEWNGATWAQRVDGPMSPRFKQALAFDSLRNRLTMFGGEGAGISILGDSWLYTTSDPIFLDQPDPITADPGDNVQFSIVATGNAPLSYVWRRNGIPLSNGGRFSGVNTPTLSISNITGTDIGSYSCVVSNPCGAATSQSAPLSVDCPADFNNDGTVDFFDYLDFVQAFDRGC
jgi:hypothetical protein